MIWAGDGDGLVRIETCAREAWEEETVEPPEEVQEREPGICTKDKAQSTRRKHEHEHERTQSSRKKGALSRRKKKKKEATSQQALNPHSMSGKCTCVQTKTNTKRRKWKRAKGKGKREGKEKEGARLTRETTIRESDERVEVERAPLVCIRARGCERGGGGGGVRVRLGPRLDVHSFPGRYLLVVKSSRKGGQIRKGGPITTDRPTD